MPFSISHLEELKSGTTHSPFKGTKMRKLVDIGEKLVELAKSNKEVVRIDKKLQKEIEKLIEKLK
jgi:hypothetical protein